MTTTFTFTGRTRTGEAVSGERVAETIDAAVAALRGDEILVTQIDAVTATRGARGARRQVREARAGQESGGFYAAVFSHD